jgi:hypothetical protein
VKQRLVVVSAAAGIAAAMLLLSACGYGLAGRTVSLPDHIKVIAVTTFTNRTQNPDLGQILTQAVQRELQGRGRWRVVPDTSTTDPDAVVSGTISGASITPKAFNQGQATRVEVFVTSAIELKDLRNNNKVIWSNPSLLSSEEFPIAPGTQANDVNAFLRQSSDATQRLALKFARTVVASMLEGM